MFLKRMPATMNKHTLQSISGASIHCSPRRALYCIGRKHLVSCKAGKAGRREFMASGAALVPWLAQMPAFADYGEGANVFGKVTNRSGFIPYAGENFAVLIPSKWNPSKEREVPNIVLRYQDNQDAANYTIVIIKPTNATSITEFGEPAEFVKEVNYLLGVQAWQGDTVSEGGFAAGTIASAALLEAATETDKKGKAYYILELLTRSADGDEGGRHQLFKATVSNGSLYILKVQAGDKRWFKGTDKACLGIINSFTVA